MLRCFWLRFSRFGVRCEVFYCGLLRTLLGTEERGLGSVEAVAIGTAESRDIGCARSGKQYGTG